MKTREEIIEVLKNAKADVKHPYGCNSEWDGMTFNLQLKGNEISYLIELLEQQPDKDSTPFACPVCNGNGLVPNGFYIQTSGHWGTTDITPEKCRSCNGTGVVWGLE